MALDSAALGSAADTLDDLIQRLRVLAAAGGEQQCGGGNISEHEQETLPLLL